MQAPDSPALHKVVKSPTAKAAKQAARRRRKSCDLPLGCQSTAGMSQLALTWIGCAASISAICITFTIEHSCLKFSLLGGADDDNDDVDHVTTAHFSMLFALCLTLGCLLTAHEPESFTPC